MAKIKGITVTLETRTKSGEDEFNRPAYTTNTVSVDNVLVGEPSTEEINDVLQIHGKRVRYVLGIPKGDTNSWIDTKVTFFGKPFRTLGEPIKGIEANIPLEWNMKVMVTADD